MEYKVAVVVALPLSDLDYQNINNFWFAETTLWKHHVCFKKTVKHHEVKLKMT